MTTTAPVRTTTGPPARTAPVIAPAGRGVAAGVLVLAAAGAAAVLGWWWANTESVTGVGGWLTGAGRITGLLAGYALPLLLLSMARVPITERHVGADRLARWHAALGRYSVGLIVAHGLLITWGYAVESHTGVLPQATVLLLSYPDVMMATAAAALLVGVGVVSARAARTRLRYETWYYLHLYTYLAVALSFAHALATGAELADHPAARWAWSALYVMAAAAVLWWRGVVPVRSAWHQRFVVERVVVESPVPGGEVVSVVLRGRDVAALDARAGQFVRLRPLTRDGWWSSHPYSLSAAPAGNLLRVTAKALGDHSTSLAALTPGTRVLLAGPYGALTAQRRSRAKVLLLAGGVGVTPLRALFQTLPAAPGDLTMVVRARSEDDLVLADELRAIAARRGQRLHLLPGRSGGDADVLVGDRLTRVLPDLADHDVYVCGPPGFTDAALAALRRQRVPGRRVHAERFAL